MTSEIAVMNKEAVALATDSAVTSMREGGAKIFTSANKLFCLSECRPVGIMIYGNASFMNIPWETLIKNFRHELAIQEFDVLEDYTENFISFLKDQYAIIPEKIQTDFFEHTVKIYFHFRILKPSCDIIESVILEQGEISHAEIQRILSAIIDLDFQSLSKRNLLPSMNLKLAYTLKTKYASNIKEIIDEVFEELPLTKNNLSLLFKIASFLFVKDAITFDYTGIVVAGFGKNNIFPVLNEFLIQGTIENKLVYRLQKNRQIDFDVSARIVPFAQDDMVAAFMEGIHPDFRSYSYKLLKRLFGKYRSAISEKLNIEGQEKNGDLDKINKEILDDYQNMTNQYIQDNHVDPIVNVVSILPKDELATMAETLVNLTSFKKRISSDDIESVGGPIDVALISKGDGFIWIKRKHYFSKDLNTRYFANLKEVNHGKDKDNN